jgi:hypothetical protein
VSSVSAYGLKKCRYVSFPSCGRDDQEMAVNAGSMVRLIGRGGKIEGG